MGQCQSSSTNDDKFYKVLCIDDDPGISQAIGIRLSQYNIETLQAYHGMHGFWMAMTERPDVVITDLRMPQGDGQYIVECLRNNSDTLSIPIIVLTGQRDTQLEQQMKKLGIDDYFTKPLDFEQLRDSLARYIDLQEVNVAAAV